MNFYIFGINSGIINGQITTLRAVYGCLKKLGNVEVIEPPKSKNFFLIKEIFIYFSKIAKLKISKKDIIYLFLNRKKTSFYIRDLPIIFIICRYSPKVICHLVGNDINIFFNRMNFLDKFLFKFFIKKIDQWVVLGKSMEKDLRRIYKSLDLADLPKFSINPGFYDPSSDNFKFTIKRNPIPTVTFMSNLMPEKGIILFLDAIEKLFIDDYLFNVLIIGNIIKKHNFGIIDRIKFMRNRYPVSHFNGLYGDNKWEALNQTDIFVLPTLYKTEYLPLALLDASSAGCYCISTSVGVIPDVLRVANGSIIQDVSVNAICEEVSKALINIELVRGAALNGSERIKENYSLLSFQDTMESMFRSL